MLVKNSVRTSKRTPHFTITNINWLTLFKEIIAVYTENKKNHKHKMQTYLLLKELVRIRTIRLQKVNTIVSHTPEHPSYRPVKYKYILFQQLLHLNKRSLLNQTRFGHHQWYSGRKITESVRNVTVRGENIWKEQGGARLSTVCLSTYSITENIYYSQLSSVAILLQPEPVSHRIIKGKYCVLSPHVLYSFGLPLPPTCLVLTVSEARSYFASTIQFTCVIQ
jgi:hypothetical protein